VLRDHYQIIGEMGNLHMEGGELVYVYLKIIHFHQKNRIGFWGRYLDRSG